MFQYTETEHCSNTPVLQASPVLQALPVVEVLPVVQVRFGVVHLGRKLLQVFILVAIGFAKATAIFREHLTWLSHTLNKLRHRTAGGFQPGGVGLRPNTVTVLGGVSLVCAARSLGENDDPITAEQA